jgi:hypothetical protein
VSAAGVVITVEPTQSGTLCGPEEADPQHTCPSQTGPDHR